MARQHNQANCFSGFSKETFLFLEQLQRNNNKAWFEEHREEYNTYLLHPLKHLVRELSDFMLSIDSHFEVNPAINRTISRIQRDTRFSKNKSPYKTTAWITFKRPNKKWRDAPAYFFEISKKSYRYGMGFYNASPHTMSLFRKAIDENSKAFRKAYGFYSKQNTFRIEGDKYVRIIDKSKPEKILDWYQRKNLYLVCNGGINNIIDSEHLIDTLISDFSLAQPMYKFLLQLVI